MKLNSFTARRGLNPVSLALGNKVQALMETKPRIPAAVQRTGPISCKESWPDKAGWYKVFCSYDAENTGGRMEHFRFIQPGVGCSSPYFSMPKNPMSMPVLYERYFKSPGYYRGEKDSLELFWYPEILAP